MLSKDSTSSQTPKPSSCVSCVACSTRKTLANPCILPPKKDSDRNHSTDPWPKIGVEIERAVWWFNPEAEGTERSVQVRCLEGEIHLEKELQPSCDFPLFKVSYTVELLPFECPVFRPVTLNKDNEVDASQVPLISLSVTIATLHGEGPVPVTFTKPLHSRKKKASPKIYDASMSMSMMSMGIEPCPLV